MKPDQNAKPSWAALAGASSVKPTDSNVDAAQANWRLRTNGGHVRGHTGDRYANDKGGRKR